CGRDTGQEVGGAAAGHEATAAAYAQGAALGALQQHHADQGCGNHQVQDEQDRDHCGVPDDLTASPSTPRADRLPARLRIATFWRAAPFGRHRDWNTNRAPAADRRPQTSSWPWPWPWPP